MEAELFGCHMPPGQGLSIRLVRQLLPLVLLGLAAQAYHGTASKDSAEDSSSAGPQPTQPVNWDIPPQKRRRIALASLAGAGIVLGSNFLGLTSALLSLDGGALAGKLRLDSLIPVNGYKRCVDYKNGFEFQYPASWLADQRLYYRYAERIEQQTGLDLPALRSRQRRRRDYSEPAAAFGPPGSSGEENISVVVAPLRPGFRLQSMGSPEQAAHMFLENIVAPASSDKTAVLSSASSRVDGAGQLYYTMEFTVRSPTFYRHNLAVYGARNDLLYTLNCQCPETLWKADEDAFHQAASSFQILSSGNGAAGYPDRL
ncbi:hypothetical protein N2152v2_007170 [Parachlorella kessleri]